VGSILVLDHWAPRRQDNSQLSLLPHRAIQRQNNEINRLDKLGNTVMLPMLVVPRLGTTTNDCGAMSPAEAKIVVSSPHKRRGW